MPTLPNRLAYKLKFGEGLTKDEKEYIFEKIKNPLPEDDLYNIIRAFALQFPASEANRTVVERFLDPDGDERGYEGAIEAFGTHWELAHEYLDHLIFSIDPDRWEVYDTVAIKAFSVLGKYVHNNDDKNILSVLLERVKTAAGPSCGKFRFKAGYEEAAFSALDYAIRGRDSLIDEKKYRESPEKEEELIRLVEKRISRI